MRIVSLSARGRVAKENHGKIVGRMVWLAGLMRSMLKEFDFVSRNFEASKQLQEGLGHGNVRQCSRNTFGSAMEDNRASKTIENE